LHVGSLSRKKFHDNSRFFEDYHTPESVYQAMYDLRRLLRRITIVNALANLPQGAVVIDVGCGIADVVAALSPDTKRVGLEYAWYPLRLARDLGCGISLLRGSASFLPIRPESADVVICLGVIDYLQDDAAALREIARVLKPGGRLVINVSSDCYFPEYFSLLGHYRHYSRQELTALLQRTQFRIVEYLDDYLLVQKLHYYPYVVFTAWHRVLNRCGWQAKSMYTRPIIGRLYQMISRGLSVLKRQRSQFELASDERSTFLIAEKLPQTGDHEDA
jgi:ubiquinone/menaquinone biosynthesis C-methylase UbiE